MTPDDLVLITKKYASDYHFIITKDGTVAAHFGKDPSWEEQMIKICEESNKRMKGKVEGVEFVPVMITGGVVDPCWSVVVREKNEAINSLLD